MSFQITQATSEDIDFIIRTIIEAERSGTDKIGLASVFNLTEESLETYLKSILEEEIEGCEFSLQSFKIAKYQNCPVGAFAGWIEGENEDGQTSSLLKSNLLAYFLPSESIKNSTSFQNMVKSISFDRILNTHQLEYAFVLPEFRGQGIIRQIVDLMLMDLKLEHPEVKKSQVQVYAHNTLAIQSYQRLGYRITAQKRSDDAEIFNFFPCSEKYLMEKIIK